MKNSHQFPILLDGDLLHQELSIIQKKWTKHFNTAYYHGEWSGIPLRSPAVKNHPLSAGDPSSTEFVNNDVLQQIPYTAALLDSFKTDKLSVRYLRLTPGSEIKAHRDHDMVFWDGFVRLHIPIITNKNVTFMVGEENLKMKPGELWFADFSQIHSVHNDGVTDRIHLVIDLRVNDWLTKLFEEEGIIEKDEHKPDPIDKFPEEAKKQMIQALLAMDTETARKMAARLSEKYGLTSAPDGPV